MCSSRNTESLNAPKVADAKAQTMIAPIACDDSKRINDMYDKIGICKSDISRKELTEEIIGIKEPMGVLHLSQS